MRPPAGGWSELSPSLTVVLVDHQLTTVHGFSESNSSQHMWTVGVIMLLVCNCALTCWLSYVACNNCPQNYP